MSALVLESISNHLTLLKEEDSRLKVLGLKKLDSTVHYHWHEISDHLADLEVLFEDESFKERELVATVLSKVYYHLETYTEAVNYALESGAYFDLAAKDQYTVTMVSKCIDRYISDKQKNFEARKPEDKVQINPKLEAIIERIFKKGIADKEYRMSLGVALDSRRVDQIKLILEADGYSSEILDYLTKTVLAYTVNRNFRREVLSIVVKAYGNRDKNNNDYINLAQALFLLNESKECADLLFELIRYGDSAKQLLAYQISSDLNDNENQSFLTRVVKELNKIENPSDEIAKARANITKLLKGDFKQEVFLRFLKENNNTDPAIVNHLKQTIDSKNSVAHESILISNGFMNAYTTDDSFLRNNLEWVAKATHWSKANATASLGTIHRANYGKAMELLKPYFPGNQPNPQWSTHSGSLFGLGLIHAGDKDQEVNNFLLNAIKNPSYNGNEILIHGACLGLGLVNLGSCDGEEDNLLMYDELKNILFMDSATSGEAAAIAIGLTMMGSANQVVINDLLTYAHETQHEKIIRSIAIALSLIVYGKEESADALIDQLCLDKDPILRYGGMYMIGLAYVATANNGALKRLLHVAVSDVSDDVRRAAVTNIGFLMLKEYHKVPKIVKLLSGSFNPYVRFGSTLALGISCAGTCNAEALKLLEPMRNDASEFVRQGAIMATAMIIQQATPQQEPIVETFKKELDDIVKKKHEDTLVRMGVLLSYGILDAGGRNTNISLLSQFGYPKLTACAGMVVFTHFWYWYPLAQFFSLTLSPSALVGVNKDLRIPKGFQFKSNAKPSIYDYPPHIKPDDKKKDTKTEAVQLSITQKAKARAAKKQAEKDDEVQSPTKQKTPMEAEEADKGEKEEEKKKDEPEPNFKICENNSRVLPKQQNVISFLEDNRYQPILNRKRGIIFLIDKNGDEREQFFDQAPGDPEPHMIPPQDFVFDEDAQLNE